MNLYEFRKGLIRLLCSFVSSHTDTVGFLVALEASEGIHSADGQNPA